jgi:hypothetical protein
MALALSNDSMPLPPSITKQILLVVTEALKTSKIKTVLFILRTIDTEERR